MLCDFPRQCLWLAMSYAGEAKGWGEEEGEEREEKKRRRRRTTRK